MSWYSMHDLMVYDLMVYDLMVCGWDSGQELLPNIRDYETGHPELLRRGSRMLVILYFPWTTEEQLKAREDVAQRHHGTGATGSPGQLFRWGLGELARRKFVYNEPSR